MRANEDGPPIEVGDGGGRGDGSEQLKLHVDLAAGGYAREHTHKQRDAHIAQNVTHVACMHAPTVWVPHQHLRTKHQHTHMHMRTSTHTITYYVDTMRSLVTGRVQL